MPVYSVRITGYASRKSSDENPWSTEDERKRAESAIAWFVEKRLQGLQAVSVEITELEGLSVEF